jgi:hypothetical protein
MTSIRRIFISNIAFTAAAIFASASHAHAGFIMTIQQVGSDVVETGSGTINTVALTNEAALTSGGVIYASFPFGSLATAGPATVPADLYKGISGPSGFGSGAFTLANSGSGDLVSVTANFGIDLPIGYVSGAALSDTSTFTSNTLAGLGLTTGVYTWTWGSGATADSFELDIGQSSTPEPSTFGLLALATAGLLLSSCIRRPAHTLNG